MVALNGKLINYTGWSICILLEALIKPNSLHFETS